MAYEFENYTRPITDDVHFVRIEQTEYRVSTIAYVIKVLERSTCDRPFTFPKGLEKLRNWLIRENIIDLNKAGKCWVEDLQRLRLLQTSIKRIQECLEDTFEYVNTMIDEDFFDKWKRKAFKLHYPEREVKRSTGGVILWDVITPFAGEKFKVVIEADDRDYKSARELFAKGWLTREKFKQIQTAANMLKRAKLK